MKKIITVLFLSLLMILPGVKVAADDGMSAFDVTLTADVTADYYVMIPNSIPLYDDACEFTVKVRGDIGGDDQIMLSVPDSITTEGRDITVKTDYFNQTAVMEYEDIKENYDSSKEFKVRLSYTESEEDVKLEYLPLEITYLTGGE